MTSGLPQGSSPCFCTLELWHALGDYRADCWAVTCRPGCVCAATGVLMPTMFSSIGCTPQGKLKGYLM